MCAWSTSSGGLSFGIDSIQELQDCGCDENERVGG